MSQPETPPATAPLGSAFQALESAAQQPKLCPTCGSRYPADFRVCPRDATALEDAPADEDPLIGATLADSYEIVRVIGEGGMGRVYEARHVRLHAKRYAIKVLHHELARQPEVVSRFQREAEAVATLRHDNIVDVFDVGRSPDGRPFIVAELLEGEELGDVLEREGALTIGRAVGIVRQVCAALAAAHARGIVHRDVKPENVCLVGSREHPTVKVLDFGISKLAEAGGDLTRTGVVMGTPAYMAPEQARGERVDERADVYAVGAILYRALTGRRPFEGLDQMATLTAVLSDEPPRPRTLRRELPEGLELVIQRAMEKRSADRFSTMAELDAALAPFQDAEPNPSAANAKTVLAASPPAQLGATSREVRFARPMLVGFAILLWLWAMALCATSVLAALRMFTGRPEPTPAELVLTAVSAAVLITTPAAFAASGLARAWRSSPRVIEACSRLRHALLSAVVVYGVLSLFVEAWVSAFGASSLTAPFDLLPPLASAAGGALSWLGRGRR